MADDEIKTVKYQHGNNRKWTGLILVIVGGFLLARQSGIYLPGWLFNWESLLILIGLVLGIQHAFRGPAWVIMIFVGSFFLFDDYYPGINIHEYIWPLMLIGIGMIFIFRPYRNKYQRFLDRKGYLKNDDWKQMYKNDITDAGDHIDVTSIMGGIKKNILSKDFKGGDVVNFFGGTDLNLSQADINGEVVLDVTQVFGGTKLILPANWHVKSDLTSLFSGIEDKRALNAAAVDPSKVLILKGTSIFGGIEILSY